MPLLLDCDASSPEILLIDEALAVGEQGFCRCSLGRIREIQLEANTVVLATRSLQKIRDTCRRDVWLDAGRIRAHVEVGEVLSRFEQV